MAQLKGAREIEFADLFADRLDDLRRGAFLYWRFAVNGIQNASRSLVASLALMSVPGAC